jgi:RNA polymerase sigma-70 factor (ECF subfamily)
VVNKATTAAQVLDSDTNNLLEKHKAFLGALSDDKLVEQSCNEDTRAIEQLIRKYNKKAYFIAYQMCSGDQEEAMDLVQDAFLKAFENLNKFNGKSSFYTWFYRILINTCLDARRRKQQKRKLFSLWRSKKTDEHQEKHNIENHPATASHSNPMILLRGKEFNQDIQNALRFLTEKQRMVFELKTFHDMKIHEIAKIMNMAPGTVKSHLFRATRYMRNALKDWKQD